MTEYVKPEKKDKSKDTHHSYGFTISDGFNHCHDLFNPFYEQEVSKWKTKFYQEETQNKIRREALKKALERIEELEETLKEIIDTKPFGIENAEQITTSAPSKGFGSGTMGSNMTRKFRNALIKAEQTLKPKVEDKADG